MVLKTEVKNGSYELIGNGSFILDPKEVTEMTLTDNESSMKLLLKFENTEDKIAIQQFTNIDSGTTEAVFRNFNSVLGYSNLSPWFVAYAFGGRKMFMYYKVSHLSGIDNDKNIITLKNFEYTCYLEKEVTYKTKEVTNG